MAAARGARARHAPARRLGDIDRGRTARAAARRKPARATDRRVRLGRATSRRAGPPAPAAGSSTPRRWRTRPPPRCCAPAGRRTAATTRSPPVAVDLRSARVRAARWLLDGVRAGPGPRRPARATGSSGPCTMPRRRADPAGTRGRCSRPPASRTRRPTSRSTGSRCSDLDRAGGLSIDDPEAVSAAAGGDRGAFDAVNDVGLFEAVHQLRAGNFEPATAMLDAMPPAPTRRRSCARRRPRGRRRGRAPGPLLLDPDATPPDGWAAGVRDAIAPALDAWVASLLPAPVTCRWRR